MPSLYRRARLTPVTLTATLVMAAGCTTQGSYPPPAAAGTRSPSGGDTANVLTVYSRDPDIAKPIFAAFEQRTGIRIRPRWGDPIQLADQIIADGDRTAADVYYGPLSDALGSLSTAGRLVRLSDDELNRVPEAYRSPDGTWVGTSGRAHVVFYNTDKLSEKDLPSSITGFTDPAWRSRIAFDPTSRSLLDIVTAVYLLRGEDAARVWLRGIAANEPAVFQGAKPIINAVSAGTIAQVGFGSHSYLYKMHADGKARNVAAKFYPGDPGGVLNVGGVGIVKGTRHEAAARAFVDFLLSPQAELIDTEQSFEIPVVNGATSPVGLPSAGQLTVPGFDPRRFEKLPDARRLITEAGIVAAY